MAADLTPDDLAAAKEQGDLVDMLLATTGRTRKKTRAAEAEAPQSGPPDYGPLHRPGTWPFGLGNPGPNTCHPDCGCAITPKPPDGSTP
ncbi:hypothetical protein [Streptomyces sp. NPDC020983]|uniref:hypothetical protein n=1 Tax=Streptomyces sp. NPDC020983 TaxID=3365106 RepID=UPI0037B75E91